MKIQVVSDLTLGIPKLRLPMLNREQRAGDDQSRPRKDSALGFCDQRRWNTAILMNSKSWLFLLLLRPDLSYHDVSTIFPFRSVLPFTWFITTSRSVIIHPTSDSRCLSCVAIIQVHISVLIADVYRFVEMNPLAIVRADRPHNSNAINQ